MGNSDPLQLELWEKASRQGELSNRDCYVALSHCWGGPTEEEKNQFCTTGNNYQRRLRGFSMDDLPKTFQDAVRVTRVLGVRFLWIDALCINQTNPEREDSDWKKEAGHMEEVFSSAYVTIAATSATNWKEGFLMRESIPQPIQAQDDSGELNRLPDELNDFKKAVDAGPLNQRAWVLQERVLSRRTIHFTRSHTYWECGKTVRCDDFRELIW